MRKGFLPVALVLTTVISFPALAQGISLRAVQEGDKVDIYAGDKLFTRYNMGAQQKYPYFYPMNGPATGESVTTESSEPYPHHHSLFFGCDRVNGGNYWQDTLATGQIRSLSVSVESGEGARVVLHNVCEWSKPGEDPIIRDTRRFVVSAPSEKVRLIDVEIRVLPLVPLRVEQTNHSLFAARMKPELSVAQGGVLVNAAGDKSEMGTFGTKSPWCDYYGSHHGKVEGLALLQHPENPLYPTEWFTRDYGFFSPTPLYWSTDSLSKGGGGWNLAQGEEVVLRYRVVVHEGDTREADIASLFMQYGEPPKP